jgi:hypothetical protein
VVNPFYNKEKTKFEKRDSKETVRLGPIEPLGVSVLDVLGIDIGWKLRDIGSCGKDVGFEAWAVA